MSSKKSDVQKTLDFNQLYSNPALSTILTMQEVMAMWNKSRRTVEMAWWKNKISGRKSVTGGSIMFTRASVVKLWGQPVDDIVDAAYVEGL